MNIEPPTKLGRRGQRPVCSCLQTKKELLSHKEQCPYECKYCYWRSPIKEDNNEDN